MLSMNKQITLALCPALLALGTQAGAALIDGSGITATASTFNTGGAGFPPIRTIDGSGLNTSTGVHSQTAGTSWLTPITSTLSEQWIQWDLGASYVLDSIHVWNANQNTNFSTRGLDIYLSNAASPGDPEGAGALNWTKLGGASQELPQANNSGGYTGFDLETATGTTLPATPVRFVRFELNSNWPGNTSYTGIAEIQFDAVVPEPGSLALLTLGGLMIARRRRG